MPPVASASARAEPRRRLGWLGPAIAVVGIAVAGLGTWYMATAKPEPGALVDIVRIDDRSTFVIRAENRERGRNFIERRQDGALIWRALIPRYAGRPGVPGLAWNQHTVSIRVQRENRAEVFALSMHDAAKRGGFKLAPGLGPAAIDAPGPVTLTDHVRSYELVAGVGGGWHQLVAVDLGTGEGLWKQDLGATPIDDGGVRDGAVWIRQGGVTRTFRATDGVEQPAKTP